MNVATLPNGMAIQEINSYETRFLYDEIFVQRAYTANGIEIEPGSVVIDAGANIGMFALYMFVEFAPGRVFCFEPAPHCLEALRANLANWTDRIVIFDSALGDREGEVYFTYYPSYSIMSGLFADQTRDLDVLKAGARTRFSQRYKGCVDERMIELLVGNKLDNPVSFKCPVTTVSHVIERNNIKRVNLLKIDVERAEGAILRGIDEEHWPQIDQLVVEVHDQGAREHEMMRDILEHRGYHTVLTVERDLENSGIYALTARRK